MLAKTLRAVSFLALWIWSASSLANGWTHLPLPLDMRGDRAQTTGQVRARCLEVGISSSGARTCTRQWVPPSFEGEQEIIGVLPAGHSLAIQEVHYDQDGYAVKVRTAEGTFWVFEPHQGPSVLEYQGAPMRDSLREIYTLFQAGDVAALLGGGPDVVEQCFYDPAVMENPLPEEALMPDPEPPPPPEVAAHQIPDFDPLADAFGDSFSPNCQSFIQSDGEYGTWGQVIASELEDSDHLSLLFDKDVIANTQHMNRICPKFANLTKEQKTRFWVWTFMSIADVESSCVPGKLGTKPSNSGHYAVGLLQMEKRGEGLDGSRSVWAQNPEPEKACHSPDLQNRTADNIRCALDTMANTFHGFHSCAIQEVRGRRPTVTTEGCQPSFLNNNWEKLRCLPEQVATQPLTCQREGQPSNDAITRRILNFKACGAKQ